MKCVKRLGILPVVFFLCMCLKMECVALQYDYKPVDKLPEGAEREAYIEITAGDTEYEVKPGDTLWGISEQFLGNGIRYREILEANADIVSEPKRLSPGKVLVISDYLYIPRDRFSRGGLVSEGAYHIESSDVRNALIELWQLDGEAKEAFLNRPIMASDVAVITNMSCMKYPSGYSSADEESVTELYLGFNGYSEKINLDNNMDFSYEDLAHFTGLTGFEIAVNDLTDYSYIKNMVHLKSLSIYAGEKVESIEFLEGLTELRTLTLEGDYRCEGSVAFSEITDISVLKNCKNLGYLFLQMPKLQDFSFLEECTGICTMELTGEVDGAEPVVPDVSLLPNARFLEFYGESLRFEP